MDSSRVNSPRGPVRALVIGIALGLGLGLLAVQVFVLLFLLPIVAIGVVWSARTTPSITPDSVATSAGILVGMGSILLLGSGNTYLACRQTEDFCGNANVIPLTGYAVVLLVVGVLAAVTTVRRAQGR